MGEVRTIPSWRELLGQAGELSLGLALLTKDASQKLLADIREKARARRAQSRELLTQARARAQEQRRSLESQLSGIVERLLQRSDLARASELRALEERLRTLEQHLQG